MPTPEYDRFSEVLTSKSSLPLISRGAWATSNAINTLRKSWKRGVDVPVATILASDASSWLARQSNLKPNSYNELSRQLKNIFELALNDRVISVSPYAGITNRRKRVTKDTGSDSERGTI